MSAIMRSLGATAFAVTLFCSATTTPRGTGAAMAAPKDIPLCTYKDEKVWGKKVDLYKSTLKNKDAEYNNLTSAYDKPVLHRGTYSGSVTTTGYLIEKGMATTRVTKIPTERPDDTTCF